MVHVSHFHYLTVKTWKTQKKRAEEYQRIQSLQKGLTKNRHRLIECDTGGKYMELQLQDGHVAKFDIGDLSLTKNGYVWNAHKNRKVYYMSQSNRKNGIKSKLFHRVLYPEYTQVDHINRDGLDNRRKNLLAVSVSENNMNQNMRKDNVSGKTGIHHSKYANLWVVQWPENGTRKKKRFSVSMGTKVLNC